MDLRNWTILYVQHKDVFARKLKDYAEENGKLVFNFKDHTMHAYAMEDLAVPPADGKTLVTTLNTKHNMEFLMRHWHEFANIPHLTIIFVNPERNEKWFIVPHTHAMIADPNIEVAIRSLSESVQLVS
jgi:hypothetical protein